MLRNLQKWAQRTALGIGLMSSIYGCGSNNPKNNQITYVPVVEAHVEEEPKEKKVDKLDQLAAIINSVDEAKAYLLSVGYDFEDSNLDDEKSNKSDPPRVSIEDGKAHCFEAVLQVAYFLEDDGFEPLLLTMYTKDKGHSIFLYKENGLYGSIAKSRLKTLESREAVFESVEDLIDSYSDFLPNGERFYRYGVSNLDDLSELRGIDWRTTYQDLHEFNKTAFINNLRSVR